MSIVSITDTVWFDWGASLRVGCNAATGNGAYIGWTTTQLNTNTTLYNVNGTSITLNRSGLYLIAGHIASTTTGTYQTEVHVGGAVTTRC